MVYLHSSPKMPLTTGPCVCICRRSAPVFSPCQVTKYLWKPTMCCCLSPCQLTKGWCCGNISSSPQDTLALHQRKTCFFHPEPGWLCSDQRCYSYARLEWYIYTLFQDALDNRHA
ncbi:hypothetical protein VPH35_017061 [Triticum aestivum]